MPQDNTTYITFSREHRHEICGTVFEYGTVASIDNGSHSDVVSVFGQNFNRVYYGNQFQPQAHAGYFKRYATVTKEMLKEKAA